jgi:hypothetical protein
MGKSMDAWNLVGSIYLFIWLPSTHANETARMPAKTASASSD